MTMTENSRPGCLSPQRDDWKTHTRSRQKGRAGTETTLDVRSVFFTQKRLLGSMASDKEDLEYGLELVEAGHIKPILDRALPLSEAAEAHRLMAGNEITGSVVLLPWV